MKPHGPFIVFFCHITLHHLTSLAGKPRVVACALARLVRHILSIRDCLIHESWIPGGCQGSNNIDPANVEQPSCHPTCSNKFIYSGIALLTEFELMKSSIQT
jgi:hypothetical protein